MCGIIGIISKKNHIIADLIAGLKRLEYRGYDSAGLAVWQDNKISVFKAVGKVINLENKIQTTNNKINSTLGIAHTRWATHGKPTINNAHPHTTDKVAIVHNGIVENYLAIRSYLKKYDIFPKTATDSEVIALLLTYHLTVCKDKVQAINQTLKQINGTYALGIIFADEANKLYGAKKCSPLAIGKKDKEFFLGSDAIALDGLAKEITFLHDGDVVVLAENDIKFYDNQGAEVQREFAPCQQSLGAVSKGKYPHFMLKEIYEQPKVIDNNLKHYINFEQQSLKLNNLNLELDNINHVNIIACGTSYYAALVAKYWFEIIAKIPVNIDIASEFRYRKPPIKKNGMAIVISQSGETADTIAALDYIKLFQQKTIGIVNVANSTIHRLADYTLFTLAGAEIGVASTKAFLTQLASLSVLILHIAKEQKTISETQQKSLISQLQKLPMLLMNTLKLADSYKEFAKLIYQDSSMLYLGRGIVFPIALEGALKIKELSYIHAEGYAAGEMKHGPIALIDPNMSVITLAPYNDLFDKTLSNLQEVIARQGKAILFTDKLGHARQDSESVRSIILPETTLLTSPFVYAIPLQLLAYYAAYYKGNDVDQPRNLAKSVTVE